MKTKTENKFVKIVRIVLLIVLSPIVLLYLMTNFVKKFKSKRQNHENIKVYKITQIDSLSGIEFEQMLVELFQKMGYKVSLTPKSKDYGADLVLVKNKQKVVVQAKCYSHTVGIKAVQEAIGAKTYYGATHAVVVSNNNFSKEAESLALESNVGLLARDELLELVLKFDVHISKTGSQFSALSEGAKAEIESKYKFWI